MGWQDLAGTPMILESKISSKFFDDISLADLPLKLSLGFTF
jgi:hypothetical protein